VDYINQTIALTYSESITINPKQLPVIDDARKINIIFESDTEFSGVKQAIYRNNIEYTEIADTYEYYSYLEIMGVKYDLGVIGYSESDSFPNGLDMFAFKRTPFPDDKETYPEFSQYTLKLILKYVGRVCYNRNSTTLIHNNSTLIQLAAQREENYGDS
jgi:hypothetical protein